MNTQPAARGSLRVRAAVATVLGTAVLFTAPAFAAEDNLEEVQVTGSRIKRATDFDTANPTTVVDADYFKNMGIVNVSDAVRQLPSNVSNNSPTTTGNANFFAGSTIANLRGLNPFFGSRTLNLVNGRRHVPTNQGDGVDLNFIPSILIERMDVVTGGASAAYGSGAISGVNNVYLNRKLDGIKAEVDHGQSSRGDAKDTHMALAFGTAFAGDRGHVSIGFEHQDSDAVGCVDARDWCAKGTAFIPNVGAGSFGANGKFSGAPQYVLANNVRQNQISYAGVFQNFIPGVFPTYGVNAAGTGVSVWNSGAGSAVTFDPVIGGDGLSAYHYTNLRAPVKRDVGALALSYEIADDVNLTVEASMGSVETLNRTGGLNAQFQAVAPDNAYLLQNAGLRAGDYFGGGNYFGFLNKDWGKQIDSYSAFDTDVQRFAAGLDGRFGDTSWTWDAYYQYGKTERSQLVNDNRHLNAYDLAVDAVFSVAGDTTSPIVCRVTRDGVPAGALYNPQIATGCVPVNPFGTAPLSANAKAYAFGYLLETLEYKQQVFAFNTTGDLFEGFGAGTVKAAAGVEYRTEKGRNTGSQGGAPDYVRTDYLIQYGESFAGNVDIIEAYGEIDVPVASNFDLNLAARWSQYDNQGKDGTTGESRSHDMLTWKLSATYDPTEWLRLRGTQSRDSRAANFRELYYGQKIWAGGIFGFCGPAGTSFADPCNWSLEGNVDLKPEKSDTTTLGVVLTGQGALEGFQFATDYFRIKITDAIQQANISRVLNGCQISNIAEFCALITPDVAGVYTYNAANNTGVKNIRALSFNGSGYDYSGFDFTGTYRLDMGDSGTLNFRLIATHMLEQTFQPTPGQPFIDITGQTGTANSFLSDNQPTAEWIGNLSATWVNGPFTATASMRYVSSGKMNYLGVTPEDANYATAPANWTRMDVNSVPSYQVFGLNASYSFEDLGFAKTLQFWGGIENLFDKDPPIATGTGFGGATNGGTNAVFYDTMGRYFKVGVRASF